MEDRAALELASGEVSTAEAAYRRAAAADLLAERESVKAHLAKSAVGLVEAPPGELAVATAISLFGFQSGAALATVVGVLIEVPVMLLVVGIVNRSQSWYEAKAN